jgi:hypothetical protein
MRESTIEKYLVKRVKEAGGLSYKFKSPNNKGVPDRIVIFQVDQVFFVELKAKDGILSEAQKRRLREMRKQGCAVFVFNSVEDINALITWVTA